MWVPAHWNIKPTGYPQYGLQTLELLYEDNYGGDYKHKQTKFKKFLADARLNFHMYIFGVVLRHSSHTEKPTKF